MKVSYVTFGIEILKPPNLARARACFYLSAALTPTGPPPLGVIVRARRQAKNRPERFGDRWRVPADVKRPRAEVSRPGGEVQ
ncbi:hypothetical protein RRG08_059250 [Elysia crispata]|uniref:Uncharacterized protein n=1 Tax=Elysia crispata TaxID=231223 RepID=A0AAE0Y8H0_9GAST|nr:hypothetical protein RRG08_059250 [Elysia crispata]